MRLDHSPLACIFEEEKLYAKTGTGRAHFAAERGAGVARKYRRMRYTPPRP